MSTRSEPKLPRATARALARAITLVENEDQGARERFAQPPYGRTWGTPTCLAASPGPPARASPRWSRASRLRCGFREKRARRDRCCGPPRALGTGGARCWGTGFAWGARCDDRAFFMRSLRESRASGWAFGGVTADVITVLMQRASKSSRWENRWR